MTNDAAEFRRQLMVQPGRIRHRSHQFQQALMLEALRRTVLRTPVDTGRARGGWQVTANAPATSAPVGAQDRTGNGTITKGAAVIATFPEGHVGYVVNNVLYILPLENGHSSQAPNGMVAVTIEELKLLSDRIRGVVVAADGG